MECKMNAWRRFALFAAASAVGLSAPGGRAAVVPVSPVDGEIFQLLPEKQRKVLAGKARVERQQVLKGSDARATRDSWRRQRPIVGIVDLAEDGIYLHRSARCVTENAALNACGDVDLS